MPAQADKRPLGLGLLSGGGGRVDDRIAAAACAGYQPTGSLPIGAYAVLIAIPSHHRIV